MLEIPENSTQRESRTVLRFYDEDGEQIVELVDSGIPAPSEGDQVNLAEMEQLEGPPNPDVIHPEKEESEWGGESRARVVEETVYHIKRLVYPDRIGTGVYQYVTVVEIHLSNPHE